MRYLPVTLCVYTVNVAISQPRCSIINTDGPQDSIRSTMATVVAWIIDSDGIDAVETVAVLT